MKKVFISKTVEEIGNEAFNNDSVMTIEVDKENANYSSVDGVLYDKERTILIACKNASGEYEIPNTVTKIDEYAFANCTGLTEVTIPDGVTEIYWGAFSSCSSLKSIEIPSSVESVGNDAFWNCTSLKSIEIPSSVESVGSDTFGNCSSLKDIYYPAELSSQMPDTGVPDTAMQASYTEKGESVAVTIEHLPDGTSISLPENICGKTVAELYYPEGATLGDTSDSDTEGDESDSSAEGNGFTDMLVVSYKEVTAEGEDSEESEESNTTTVALTIENIPSGVTSICLPDSIGGKEVSSVTTAEDVSGSGITELCYPKSLEDEIGEIFTNISTAITYTVNDDGEVVLTVEKVSDSTESITLPSMIGGKQIVSIEFSDSVKTENNEEIAIKCSKHNPGEEVYTDASNHWYVCTVCGELVEKESHSYGEYESCECGYVPFKVTASPESKVSLTYNCETEESRTLKVAVTTETGIEDRDIAYQWYKNEEPIAGESAQTSSYTIPVDADAVSGTSEEDANADTMTSINEVGDYTLTIEGIGNYTGIVEKEFSVAYYPSKNVTVLYNGETTKAEGYADDVIISAKGFTVSDKVDGEYSEYYTISQEGSEVAKTLYFKETKNGYITDGMKVTVKIDRTAPAIDVSVPSKAEQTLTDTTASFAFTANEDGTYYYMVKEKDETAPETISDFATKQDGVWTANEGVSQATMKAGENNSIKLEKLTADTAYVCYIMAVDKVENVAVDIVSVPFTTLKTIPALSPENEITVKNGVKTVGEIGLVAGWKWDAISVEQNLAAGETVKATAIYTEDDSDDYYITSKTVAITREACKESETVLYTEEGEYAPTCENAGVGHTVCSICEDVMRTAVKVEATGHNLTEVEEKKASCTEDGKKAHWACEGCEKLYADAEGKNEITDASVLVIAQTGHSWDEGVVTKEPSETETGVKTYTCECGATKTEVLPVVTTTESQEDATTTTQSAATTTTEVAENETTEGEPSTSEGDASTSEDAASTTTQSAATTTVGAAEHPTSEGKPSTTEGNVGTSEDTTSATTESAATTTAGVAENPATEGKPSTSEGDASTSEDTASTTTQSPVTTTESAAATTTQAQTTTQVPATPDTTTKANAKNNKATTTKVPKKGTLLKDTAKKAVYKVTKAGKTVEYVKPVKNTNKAITIPATIKVDGITYKVTSIAKNALKDNKNVTKLVIGKNVKTIGKKAFAGCNNLKKITIKTKLLEDKTVKKQAFKGIHSKAVMKVPKGKADAYKNIFQKKGITGITFK